MNISFMSDPSFKKQRRRTGTARHGTSDSSKSRTENLKAKIIRLNSKHHLGMFIDNGEQKRIKNEEPSLHNLLNIRKRQGQLTIHQLYDTDGSLKTSPADIVRVFTDYMGRKYDHIQVNEERMRHMMNCGLKTIHTALEESITMEEIFQAVKQGKSNKAPGQDGICIDVIKKTWEGTKYDLLEIMNNMYRDGIISDQQNHGIFLCVSENPDSSRIEDYRPLTLINTDYKLFTKIIPNCLRP